MDMCACLWPADRGMDDDWGQHPVPSVGQSCKSGEGGSIYTYPCSSFTDTPKPHWEPPCALDPERSTVNLTDSEPRAVIDRWGN